MLDLLGTRHLLLDGIVPVEVWCTKHHPDWPSGSFPSGAPLLGAVRRLLLEPGNRRVIAALVEGACWYATRTDALDEVFVDLVERGIFGIRRRVDHASGALAGRGDAPITTPVEPAEPLVRPGIDDLDLPTFIAVALRDDARGEVFADYTLTTDGTPRPGRFVDERGTRVEPIDPRASCSIVLEHIPVPSRPAPARPEPEIEPEIEPATPTPRAPAELWIAIADEAGTPLSVPVCRVLQDGEPALEQALDDRPVHLADASTDARYTLAFQGLRLPEIAA